jgi:hypothetical protein
MADEEKKGKGEKAEASNREDWSAGLPNFPIWSSDQLWLQNEVAIVRQLLTIEKDIFKRGFLSRLRNSYREAHVRLGQGNLNGAIDSLNHILSIEQEVLGEINPTAARMSREIARLHVVLGNRDQASRLINEAVRIEAELMNKQLGEDEQRLPSASIPITLKSPRPMTAIHLADEIAPYLRAVAKLQRIVDEIKGLRSAEVQVVSLRENSPITATLSGAVEAVELMVTLVVPWRRKHAEMMARLTEREKLFQIENLKAELLARNKDQTEQEKEALALAEQREKVEKLRLENEKLRVEVHEAKIELALRVIEQVGPHLSETQKIGYVTALLEPLEVLMTSEVEMELTSPPSVETPT